MFRFCYIALSLVATAIAAITVSAFGWADGLSIVAALAVAWIVPMAAGQRRPWWTPACTVAFGAVALVLVASAVNYIYATTLQQGATLEMPVLDCDAGGYYNWALHHYDGRCAEPLITFFGFPLAMLALWRVLGVSIVWPVAMNLMFTLATVAMAASLAVTFTRRVKGLDSKAVAPLAIALMGLHGYFLSQGFVIQKEALVYLAMTMVAMCTVGLQQQPSSRRRTIGNIALYAAACVILALVRAKYINFAAFAVGLLAITRWRTRWRPVLALVAVTGVTWLMGMYCSTTYNVDQQVLNVAGGEAMGNSFMPTDANHAAYLNFMGGYFVQPVWKRLLLLPVTLGTQFVIPLPWGAESAAWTSVMPRVRVGWYLCGGVVLSYYAILSWRRGVSLGAVSLWPVLCAVAIAFISGGTVSRYILPFQPLFTAITVYTAALAVRNNPNANGGSNKHHNNSLRRPLLAAYILYLLLLTATLTTLYLHTH